jgi:hypothetical protein
VERFGETIEKLNPEARRKDWRPGGRRFGAELRFAHN